MSFKHSKMTPWLMAFFCLATAGCSNVTDQQTSETHQDQQVAILKQIRKVNEDGSYTYGYEAGDGSFKVESRDVLGNIKGTFGFVDAEGEIKRISYSSSNGTGFKATTMSPLQEHVSVVQSIPRANRTSSSSSTSSSSTTTRKPKIVYAASSSTEQSPTKSSVVQSIPRTRKPGNQATSTTTTSTTTTTSGNTTPSTEPAKPIFNHYLRGASSKSKPRFVINGQQRPIVIEEGEIPVNEDSQINRPNTEDKSIAPYRRIMFAKRPIEHTLRPISEDFVDKEEDPKITTGNTLRRQLHDETTKVNSNSGNSGNSHGNDDHSDVYGGTLSTTRPLFTTSTTTTSTSPRILQRLRMDKAKSLYVNNRENVGPARFDDTRGYETTEPKNSQDDRTPTPVLIRAPMRVSPEVRDYVRQGSEPIFVRQQPEQYGQDIPARRILVPASQNPTEEDNVYRSTPISRILLRPLTTQQQVYSSTTDSNVQYLTESAPVPNTEEDANYIRTRPVQRPLIYTDQDSRTRILRPVSPQSLPPMVEDRTYQQPISDYPYRESSIALPPELPNPIPPPLSRRDFQLLLRRLLVSQYGARALAYPKTYLEDALYDQPSYPAYGPGYQSPLHRPQDLAYDQQTSVPMSYGERVPLRRPVYTRALNPIYQGNHYDDYHNEDPRYTKRVYRQKFYAQEIGEDGDEILPSPVREALLLRMLQLAINNDRAIIVPGTMSTTAPTSRYRKNGPVRSVQIITDESEEDKDTMSKTT